MLSRTKIKIGVVVTLIGIIGFLGWRYESAIRTTAQQAYQITQQLQHIDDMSNRIDEIKELQETNKRLMEEYVQHTREITAEYKGIREDLEIIIEQNEEAKEWADSKTPDSILRTLPPEMIEIIEREIGDDNE